MNYVAIDTSGKNLTVIVCKNDIITSYFDTECGVNHSVALMPKLEELCEKASFNLSDADFFACVVGAGSFTGIRIGVATVKALCFAYNKPCLSITSFDTLAYNVYGEKVLALIDAKHNGFYACGYDKGEIIFEPSYILREKLEEIKGDYKKIVAISEIDGLDISVVSVENGLKLAVLKKADKISFDLESLVPLYCRKSQAEERR